MGRMGWMVDGRNIRRSPNQIADFAVTGLHTSASIVLQQTFAPLQFCLSSTRAGFCVERCHQPMKSLQESLLWGGSRGVLRLSQIKPAIGGWKVYCCC